MCVYVLITLVVRLTALAYGLVCLAMAYLASVMGSVLQVTVDTCLKKNMDSQISNSSITLSPCCLSFCDL